MNSCISPFVLARTALELVINGAWGHKLGISNYFKPAVKNNSTTQFIRDDSSPMTDDDRQPNPM